MAPTTGVSRSLATALGVLSIVLWSTTVAFSRDLTEHVGTFTAAAGIYLIGGLVGAVGVAFRGGLGRLARLPRNYLFGCGGLFVLYTIMLYLAIGLSANHQQTVEAGIVNYLWPSFTLLFAVPLLGQRWRLWLAPGMLLALVGVVLAMIRPDKFDVGLLAGNLRRHPLPYLFAFVGAVTWGLHSNLARRWGGSAAAGAAPVFLLASGVAFLAGRFFVTEHSVWSVPTAAKLAYMGLLPALAGYAFWDVAMRRGHVILVGSLSYFTPLISTLISCVYLGVPMGWNLWAACILLIGGAAVCKRSIYEYRVTSDE